MCHRRCNEPHEAGRHTKTYCSGSDAALGLGYNANARRQQATATRKSVVGRIQLCASSGCFVQSTATSGATLAHEPLVESRLWTRLWAGEPPLPPPQQSAKHLSVNQLQFVEIAVLF
jgi:hypothetical protein